MLTVREFCPLGGKVDHKISPLEHKYITIHIRHLALMYTNFLRAYMNVVQSRYYIYITLQDFDLVGSDIVRMILLILATWSITM